MSRSQAVVWGLAVASLAVGATGVATAATSSSAKYVACASTKNVLSVESHKKCPKGTKKVTLAARGPAGAKGAMGPKGSPGATGPSKVYEFDYSKNGGSGGGGGGTAPLLDGSNSSTLFTVPPGSYVMHYDLNAYNATGAGWVQCTGLYSTATSSLTQYGQTAYADVAATGMFGNYGSGSATEPLTVTTPTRVAVTCDEEINTTMVLEYLDVTATQTGSLAATGFAPS